MGDDVDDTFEHNIEMGYYKLVKEGLDSPTKSEYDDPMISNQTDMAIFVADFQNFTPIVRKTVCGRENA